MVNPPPQSVANKSLIVAGRGTQPIIWGVSRKQIYPKTKSAVVFWELPPLPLQGSKALENLKTIKSQKCQDLDMGRLPIQTIITSEAEGNENHHRPWYCLVRLSVIRAAFHPVSCVSAQLLPSLRVILIQTSSFFHFHDQLGTTIFKQIHVSRVSKHCLAVCI